MFDKIIKRFLRRLLNFLPLFGVGFSLLLLLHGLWQLDLICVGPVWQVGWCMPPNERLADVFFQCGFWFQTTVGMAYDFYLSLVVVSWFVLLISMWFWHRKKVKQYRETIGQYHETMEILSDENLMKAIREARKKGSTSSPYEPLT